MPANVGKTPTPEGRRGLLLPGRPLLYMLKPPVAGAGLRDLRTSRLW